MRRWFAFVLALGFVVALAGALARIPEALARVEAFRITEIRLEGNRFLSAVEAAKALAISPLASTWDDLDPLEERVRAHPLVEDCWARRRFPRTLILKVVEEAPVALVPNPALEPVDAAGRFLPIDPSEHGLDLPIITGSHNGAAHDLSTAERRLLAEELARLGQGHPELLARISELRLDSRGELWAQFWRRDPQGEVWDLPVTLRFRPNLPEDRVQEGLRVLGDAMTRFEGALVAGLDLRYDDQVVVRLNRAEGN
jgi:hypothetical protein